MAALNKYIVTYNAKKVGLRDAAEILCKSAADIRPVVDTLGPDIHEEEDAAHHFQESGFSLLPLCAAEIDHLRGHSDVDDVTQDFPIQIQKEVASRDVLRTDNAASAEPSLADYLEELQSGQKIPWNIRKVGADKVWHKTRGTGVRVAVLDTGIDNGHQDLNVAGGRSFVPGARSWHDDSNSGHGTHCAGIIGARNNDVGMVGVAPGCQLYAFKILDQYMEGRFSDLIHALYIAGMHRMDIVSISCQWLDQDVRTEKGVTGTKALQYTVDYLHERGCTIVAAAGNFETGEPQEVRQPALTPGIIAVGATDANDASTSFSCWQPGEKVSMCAPGEGVCSTVNQGYEDDPEHGYREKSGTSQACPHVAGAAALLKELHPDWGHGKISDVLESSVTDLGGRGRDPRTGYGLLNCHKAVFG